MRPTLIISLLILITILAAGCVVPGPATPSPTAAASFTSTVQTAAPSVIGTSPAGSGTVGPTAIGTTPAGSTTPAPTHTSPPTGTALADNCPTTGLAIADWTVYCNDPLGFYIQYPPESEWVETQPNTIQASLPIQPGTNLGEKYLEISTQHSSEPCTSPLAQGYAPGSLASEEVEFNGTTFTKQSGADAGAGNFYNWTAYTTAREGVCVSFGFVLHSTNPMNYPTPPPEYDVAAESAVFEQIMNTFGWYTP